MRKGVVVGLDLRVGVGVGVGLRVGFGFGFGFGFGLGRLGLELTWRAAAPLPPFAAAHSHGDRYPAAG